MSSYFPARTAFFWSTFSAYEPVLWAEIELILREKAKGARIVGVYCDGVLPRCHAMRSVRKDHHICGLCNTAWYNFVEPLLDVALRLKGPSENIDDSITLTQEGLRAYERDGNDLGTAVLSTLKTDLGDDDPVLTARGPDIAMRLSAARTVQVRLTELLEDYHPDIVYFFNGRQFDSRPLLRLCQSRGIPFRTYETAIAPNRFTLRENTTVHDVAVAKAQFSAFLEGRKGGGDKTAYLESIREGLDIYGYGFRRGQTQKKLPASFSTERRNIVILHSSEDEYADVDRSLRLLIGKDFVDFLSRLLVRLGDAVDLRVYVRIHPRLARYRANSVRKLLAFSHPLLEVVPPDSAVDTFSLALAADLCICYGSTAGPEAVLLGARVINVGECTYTGAGIMPDIDKLDELVALVHKPEGVVCSPERAQDYLDFLRSGGEQFSLLEPDAYRLESLPMFRSLDKMRNSMLRLRIPIQKLGIGRLVLKIVRKFFFS